MKKLVFASVMALASICLVSAPTLRAQDSGTITIKDPAEFAAYTQATTQSDPKAKAAAIESFLQTYPQSVVKNDMLSLLVDAYQQAGDVANALSAAKRLLQVDPNNLKAIFLSVAIEKGQCQKAVDASGNQTDTQPCDDAAALAQKGLVAPKPASVADADWKAQTAAGYPVFDSAIAWDDSVSKKDFKAAIAQYKAELTLLPAQATTAPGIGLSDTLNLAEAYIKQETADAKPVRDALAAVAAATDPTAKAAAQKTLDDAKAVDANDYLQAIYFYARVLNFAPAGFKPQIEKKLDYWYNRYHGGIDGLDAVKTLSQATEFPPAGYTIAPAPTTEEKIHKILVSTPDLTTLALADKELVLTYGAKDDADKLWALMKDKDTPVPGIVIAATASQIKVAVTEDAKQAKTADFIVNLKTPLADKEIPAVGSEFKLLSEGGPELDGTYDTYTQIAATDTASQSAQLVLRDGFIQEKKKAAPVHKPTPAHRATH